MGNKQKELAEFRRACRQDPESVKWRGRNPLTGAEEDSCLHLAIDGLMCEWRIEAIRILIECGADPDARNSLGETPLHKACAIDARDSEVVQLLLEGGADPNLADARGQRPIDFAVGSRDEVKRIIQLLLEHGAHVDFDNAVRLGDVTRVRRYLRKGNLSQSKYPKRLLVNAILSRSVATLELLLVHGADPNPCVSRESPLRVASDWLSANVAMVRLLLEYGANPNPKRYKPLSVARDKEIIELLVNAGARRGNASKINPRR